MVIGIHLASLHTLYSGSIEPQTKCFFLLYHSSIRSSWPYGQSPGSLSSNDYWGHLFWDTETWMYPTLLLYPEIARSLLLYRFQRMNAARENARSHNVSGRSAQVGQLSLSLSGKMGGIAKSSISDVPICFGITDIAL